jgi:hypothetical protein
MTAAAPAGLAREQSFGRLDHSNGVRRLRTSLDSITGTQKEEVVDVYMRPIAGGSGRQ